jgi:ribosomal protein S18 acetylase RimI-like enzyme
MMSIDAAGPNDGRAAAELHVSSISEGFLSSLGVAFLARLYDAMARSPDAVLLVAKVDGRTAGFIAGSAHPGRFYRWFLRTRGPLAALSLVPALIHPSVAIKIGETLRQLLAGPEQDPAAELLAIAVSGDARRGGLGAALVERLEQELLGRDADRLVVVVGSSNAAARSFYERMGFSDPVPIRVHHGTSSVRYGKDLRPSSG